MLLTRKKRMAARMLAAMCFVCLVVPTTFSETYTLTTRITPDAVGTGGLPAGQSLGTLTNADTLDLTQNAAAQLYLNAAVTVNANVLVSGTGFGTERTGKLRTQSKGSVLAGTITLAGDTLIGSHSATADYDMTITGQITGTGNLVVTLGNTNTLYLGNASSGTPNNFVGALMIGSDNCYNGNDWAGSVVMKAANQIPGDVVMNSYSTSAFARLNLNGFDQTIAGLSTTNVSGANPVIFNGGSVPAVLTIGANNGSGTFNGNLGQDNGNNFSLVKTGSGTITIGGAWNYTGSTTIDAGLLGIYSTATPTITRTFSGAGGLLVKSSGTLGQGDFKFANADLSGLTGGVTIDNARMHVVTQEDLGPATGQTVTVLPGGQLFVVGNLSAATGNVYNISGDGWLESAGRLGALRLSNGTVSGTINVVDDASINAYGSVGTLNTTASIPSGKNLSLVVTGTDGKIITVGSSVFQGEGSLTFKGNGTSDSHTIS